jgi:hypothetical protein
MMGAGINPVNSKLSVVKKRIKILYVIYGIATTIFLICLFLIGAFIFDFLLHLPKLLRLILLLSGIGILGFLFYTRILFPILLKISDEDIALLIERRYPFLKQRLISTIQFSKPDYKIKPDFCSPALVQKLINETLETVKEINFNEVFTQKPVVKKSLVCLLVLIIAFVPAIIFDRYSSIFLQRLFGQDINWPKYTHLNVSYLVPSEKSGWQERPFVDNTAYAVKDEEFKIRIKAKGRIPSHVKINYQYETGERGRALVPPLPEDKSVFDYTFTEFRGPLKFYVRGGDDTTKNYMVKLITPPEIESAHYCLIYPKYTGLKSTPKDKPIPLRDFEAPEGTQVLITACADTEIDSASLMLKQPHQNERPLPAKLLKDSEGKKRIIKCKFVIKQGSNRFYIKISKNIKGYPLQNRRPIIYVARGKPDTPPQFQIIEPARTESYVSNLCRHPLRIITRDDYLVSEVGLEYKIHKKTEWQKIKFGEDENTIEANGKIVHSTYILSIPEIGAKIGETVIFFFYAKDNKEKQPNKTTSSKYRFYVISVGELESRLFGQILSIKDEITRQRDVQERHQKDLKSFMQKPVNKQSMAGLTEFAVHQDGITSITRGFANDLTRIKNIGKYNRVFDEKALSFLENAVQLLELICGKEEEQTGLSPLAKMVINKASKTTSKQQRDKYIKQAVEIQDKIYFTFGEVLDELARWSKYQEVVRRMRALKEAQEEVIEILKAILGGER